MTIKSDDIIDEIYKTLPADFVKSIKAKKTQSAPSKNMVRVQVYIPTTWFSILEFYGAFVEGEGDYVRRLIRDNILARLRSLERTAVTNHRRTS